MKRLFGLLLFALVYVANAFGTQLVGTLQTPDGLGFTGTLYLSIVQQVGVSSLGTCGGPKLVVPTAVVVIPINNGTATSWPNVYGASCTLPAGMPYNATLKDPQGNVMFTTQWLIDGTTQDVGTVYQGPSPIPPTAFTAIYGTGLPGSQPCSPSSMYVQVDASGGNFLFPCINNIFQAQGGGGGGGGATIGSPVTGASPNVVLFVDASGNLAQDDAHFNYDKITHVLTVSNPIAGSITGNSNTANSFASAPTNCLTPQVSIGITANGTSNCRNITFSDLSPAPAYTTSAATSAVLAAGSGTTTVTINAVPGDALLVAFSFQGGLGGVSGLSVSDSHGDTFSNSGLFSGGTPSSTTYLALNVAGGSTTVTLNWTVGGTATLVLGVADYRNVVTASAVDGSAVNSGASITDSGAITTAVASDLLISPIFSAPSVSVSSTAGFNQDSAFVGVASGYDLRFFSKLSGAAGSYDSTVSFGAATARNIGILALKGASSSFPVVSVFGRTGAVAANTGDYTFSQIGGTLSVGQLPATALINPMTNIGDLILGGTAGAPTVLPIGTAGQIVSSNGTTASWANPSSLGIMTTSTVVTATQFPVLTGDVTTPGNSLVTTLSTTGVTAGACGDASHFCIPTFDAKGRTLSFTTQAVSTGLTIKTNGISNTIQTILDLINGPGITITNDALTGKTQINNTYAINPTPIGISQNVDWPPTVTNVMNDEFTDAVFNTSNIWTVVNQGSDTIINKNSLLSVGAVAHAGDNFVGIYQLTPSTPYAVTAKISLTGVAVTGYYGGLAVRDSATGRVVAMRIGNGSTLLVDHWSGPTTVAANVYSQALDSSQPIYMTIKDDGTNFTFSISRDGVNFVQVFQEGRTAYLAVPGQIGYMTGSSNATYPMTLGSDWFRRTL